MLQPMKMKVSSKKLSKMMSKWKERRGHFVVYSKDNIRFLVPLRYLNHPIFRVLLEMAEEEYGLTIHGPLRIPYEKEFVDFILTMLDGQNSSDHDVDLSISRLHANSTFLL